MCLFRIISVTLFSLVIMGYLECHFKVCISKNSDWCTKKMMGHHRDLFSVDNLSIDVMTTTINYIQLGAIHSQET